MSSELIDPVAVAHKVLATSRGWSKTSVFEIKAMAGYIIYQDEDAADPEAATPVFEGEDRRALDGLDAIRVPKLIAEIKRTFHELETARFSARESACRHAYRQALNALSDHFSMEIFNVQR